MSFKKSLGLKYKFIIWAEWLLFAVPTVVLLGTAFESYFLFFFILVNPVILVIIYNHGLKGKGFSCLIKEIMTSSKG